MIQDPVHLNTSIKQTIKKTRHALKILNKFRQIGHDLLRL
jgi:hypothetical protein